MMAHTVFGAMVTRLAVPPTVERMQLLLLLVCWMVVNSSVLRRSTVFHARIHLQLSELHFTSLGKTNPHMDKSSK